MRPNSPAWTRRPGHPVGRHAYERRRTAARAASRAGSGPGRAGRLGGAPGGRDLEQVRDAIDAARALLGYSSGAYRNELGRCATRSRSSRWPTRRRSARPAAEAAAGARRRGPRRPRANARGRERRSPAGSASRTTRGGPGAGPVKRRLWVRAAEAAVPAPRRPAVAGGHDRLRRAFAPGRRSH